MVHPDYRIHADSASLHAKGVERRVQDLRSRGRLALHIVENYTPLTFPEFSYKHINRLRADEIRSAMANPKAPYPLMSMTLLPKQSNVTLYETGNASMPQCAYAVNMDQTQPNPPIIYHADVRSLLSGNVPYTKLYKIDRGSFFSDELNEFYDEWELSSDDLETKRQKRSIAIAKNPNLTTQQLDIMNHYYEASDKKEKEFSAQRHNFLNVPMTHRHHMNELLVASAAEHIAAITVVDTSPTHMAHFLDLAMQDYVGAMVGMQHEQRGIHLPVMRYYALGNPDQAFDYIAQGKDELCATMKKAIETLSKHVDEVTEKYGVQPSLLIERANKVFDTDFEHELTLESQGRAS